MADALAALKDPFEHDFPSFLEVVLEAPAAPTLRPHAGLARKKRARQEAQREPEAAEGTAGLQREAKRWGEQPGDAVAEVLVPVEQCGAAAVGAEPQTKGEQRGNGPGKRKKPVLCEVSVCCAFSGKGSYLASGTTQTGRVILRDMVTKSIVCVLKLHDASVTSVTYLPRCESRLLLTTAQNGSLKVHDLNGFRCLASIQLEMDLVGARVAPIFDLQGGPAQRACLVLCSTIASGSDKVTLPWPQLFALQMDKAPVRIALLALDPAADKSTGKPPKSIAADFSSDGAVAFVGGFGGDVHLFKVSDGSHMVTQQPLKSKRGGWVRNLVVKGRIMLLQINDKVIHMLRIVGDGENVTIEHLNDFQDSVENTKWGACTVSNDGEYIIGACAKTHDLHVWNVLGRHMATLHAPDRGMVRDVVWHPCRPMVVSLGRDGQTMIWATHRSEAWSAFAPNFIQLQENVRYVEREDEFDKNPRPRSPTAGAQGQAQLELQPVDICSVEYDHDQVERTEFRIPFLPV